jgi:hypothetical protein
MVFCHPAPGTTGGPPPGDPLASACQAGSYNWISYQPTERFWPFQYIEAGIFVVLSAVLLYLAIRRVRKIS